MQKNCSNCGKGFDCGAVRETANGTEELSCWCTELPHVGVVASPDQDCLCPECLAVAIERLKSGGRNKDLTTKRGVSSPPSLVEGDDYYVEGAAIVFTASYHLRRGYCCENRCRHCPYGPGAK